MVQHRRATVETPPVRRVPGLGGQIKELRKSVGKVCEWKHPRAPTIRLLFNDERATLVVLQFRGIQRSGRWWLLAPPGRRKTSGRD